MRKMTRHEEVRLKITAFLFNNRANALRGEMHRALCLYVLSEMAEPCMPEEVADLIVSLLGRDVGAPRGFVAIVLDELRGLVK